jgi:hypothetical protein
MMPKDAGGGAKTQGGLPGVEMADGFWLSFPGTSRMIKE